jgi:hypothetical protein
MAKVFLTINSFNTAPYNEGNVQILNSHNIPFEIHDEEIHLISKFSVSVRSREYDLVYSKFCMQIADSSDAPIGLGEGALEEDKLPILISVFGDRLDFEIELMCNDESASGELTLVKNDDTGEINWEDSFGDDIDEEDEICENCGWENYMCDCQLSDNLDNNNKIATFSKLFKEADNSSVLELIFHKTHKLWLDNLKNISQVNYIMFCEAPPFDANGEVSNYIYDREGQAKGMYLKAPYKALKGVVDKYPSKAEMIDYLNSRGFLFIDLLPLSINFSPKRNTKKYEDFVKYFWKGSGTDLGFPEFIVQNRLNELQGKISPNVKVCFALRSVWKIVNSLSDSSLKIGDYKMDISNETLVGLNTAGQPDVNLIMKAFNNEVITITKNKQPLILPLYEEFKMIFECYIHFSITSGTEGNIVNVFFEEHPEVKQLEKEDRDRLRREAVENYIELTQKERKALYEKNIVSLKESTQKQQVLKGFLRLFSTNEYKSTDLMTNLLDYWVFDNKNEVIYGVSYKGDGYNRVMFWNEMLKNGLNPMSDSDYITFYNIIILNAKPSYVLSSIIVNTINCSEKIIQHFGYSLGSPELIVKHRFKEFFISKYRWVREAVAACSIFDVDDIKEFVSNAPERYILKGFLANNNLSSELKSEILNLLEDEVKFPIEMETYTIANSNNVSPIEISSGICDGVDLLAHFKEGNTIDLIESLRCASYGHSMFGVDEFADTLILESGEMESISLTKTSKDNNIIHKVENGKFSFCVYESSKIKNPLEDWKKYSVCLEGYLDTTKISSDTERVIIDGHSEYNAIIGYTYTTNEDKKIHFDEIEDFNSVGIDQYVCLYFGYNDKWIELDFDELCSEIQVRELNISTEEELVKFIKEFLNKQTNNIKETIIMGELCGIIDNINPEKITDWLVPYAENLETEDRHEVLVLGINRSDLENANADNILELGSVVYGDWDALIDYMPRDGVIEEDKESIAFISETKEECEECINFDCDCDYNFHRVVLLCEKSYVWSITLFSRR